MQQALHGQVVVEPERVDQVVVTLELSSESRWTFCGVVVADRRGKSCCDQYYWIQVVEL